MSLILGFFMLWDLPKISRGVSSLKQVRAALGRWGLSGKGLVPGHAACAVLAWARRQQPQAGGGQWVGVFGAAAPALTRYQRAAKALHACARIGSCTPNTHTNHTMHTQSRLAPIYDEVAPVLSVFGRLFGKALQAQVRC